MQNRKDELGSPVIWGVLFRYETGGRRDNMLRNIKTQINILARQKGVNICFWLLLLCVVGNYLRNIWYTRSIDCGNFRKVAGYSVWARDNVFGWYILTFFAFLLVLPGGLSLAKEKQTRMEYMLICRSGGRMRFYVSKIIAVFVVTFLCFTLPFLIELVLDYCAFNVPVEKNWNDAYVTYCQSQGVKMDYFLNEIHQNAPILYALVRIGITGVWTAALAMVPLACSCIYSKYYAYLMVPAYFLLLIFQKTKFSVFHQNITHNYLNYFWWLDDSMDEKGMIVFSCLIGIVALVSIGVILIHAYKGGEET